MTGTIDADLVIDCGNHLGEGIQWHPRQGRLYWTDIEGRQLWSADADGGSIETRGFPERIC